ncbi:hypothetical protein GL213_09135 [Halogeometricum borinquense]|uniref:Uncharacterized protein n=1 Tax=Halogeometricum borinquense TaxID=60847 RepID=A0A6C0UIL2_9EURY|nr:hypothetical protein [Halogeometricum borinquense]QIB74121.1 hypothetical protein G3I44_07335 [Halogeometricum borinquense]QIQ76671.1 hypothetical protein GL213_09135 [Halogeometricum borinquense]
MRLRDALRRAASYQLRALPPTVIGLGLVGAGVWYGLNGGTTLATATATRLVPAVVLAGVGLGVTAVGRTAVRLDANAAAVSDRLDGSSIDEDDLRETVVLATERAVADSIDGATAEIEARVTDAVEEAVANSTKSEGKSEVASPTDPASRADILDSNSAEPDALADATRRASERVESYLESEDADVGDFRQLAEGATVLDESDSGTSDTPDRAVVKTDGQAETSSNEAAEMPGANETETRNQAAEAPGTESVGATKDDESVAAGDGAEIIDDNPADPDLPDGGNTDDAEIIDADTEMVFGSDVKDPDDKA